MNTSSQTTEPITSFRPKDVRHAVPADVGFNPRVKPEDHAHVIAVAPYEAYLAPNDWIDFTHPEVERVAKNFRTAEAAYLFVRDTIRHSYDIGASEVTATASEVLAAGHGICYAKAHLLAALLRAMGVPAGLSYQRLVLFDDPKDGHSLHAVNTLYLAEHKRWIRVDARGNKPGVNAQFRTDREMLAFPIRPELGEVDYPGNFATPPPPITEFYTLPGNITDLYTRCLPGELDTQYYAG